MKLLATTDGSEPSVAALRHLERILDPVAAEVCLLSVADTSFLFQNYDYLYPDQLQLDEFAATSRKHVADGRKILEAEGFSVEELTGSGFPSEGILQAARSHDVDLIEVGAHGYTGFTRFLLGSVSSRIVESADRSVIVVRPPAPGAASDRVRILAATDGSPSAEDALELLGTLLPARRCEVLLVTVQPPVPWIPTPLFPGGHQVQEERLAEAIAATHEEFLSRGARILSGQGFTVKTSALSGDPSDLIVKTADAQRPDLVVVGSHGRSGLGRFVLGSVSARVVEHCAGSVLVARKKPGAA